MKKYIGIIVMLCLCCAQVSAKREKKPQEVDSLGNKIKTGWNFGVLPSVAYDADRGFQGGLLGNIYFYGDGSQYPEYIHSIYFEGAYSTKHNGIARVHYDSKYLIPNHRVTLDATYVPDAMCDFYGFNGYQSVYNRDWAFWKKNPNKMSGKEEYQSRVFYKYRHDMIRFAGDFEGTIYKNLKWNAGLGVLAYIVSECDVDMLNGKKEFDPEKEHWEQKPLDPSVKGLYEKYCDWGLIGDDEKKGGWHPYARGGFSYDTRDKRQGPNRGIYADAFFTYTAAFNSATYGRQAAAGYNYLQFNATFRHYVPCFRDSKGQHRITFAYRIGLQNTIAGQTPFYMQNYLNTQFIQRMFYEGLGGGNSIRGLMANRVLANGFAYANIEFRFRVVNFDIGRQHFFVGLNPFLDIAEITQPYQLDKLVQHNRGMNLNEAVVNPNLNLERQGMEPYNYSDFFSDKKGDIYRPHTTAGIGLKVGMNENFVLSADWAMPVGEKHYMEQDNGKYANFYIKMGYLF